MNHEEGREGKMAIDTLKLPPCLLSLLQPQTGDGESSDFLLQEETE
jgi:hypothetical protein